MKKWLEKSSINLMKQKVAFQNRQVVENEQQQNENENKANKPQIVAN